MIGEILAQAEGEFAPRRLICSVKLLAHSTAVHNIPIATFKLRYPRMIHSEFMTHRVFSRNASSSRAIPVAKLSVTTQDDLYVPQFRKNKAGMQAGDYLNAVEQYEAERIWRQTAEYCLDAARRLADKEGLNVHKQWTNRMIEWFGYINVLVTSTDWANFFALRTELNTDGTPMAQDEIYDLACQMRDILAASTPKLLEPGEWHLPFCTTNDRRDLIIEDLLKIDAARCASLSYETVEGEPMTPERAEKVFAKLVTANRMHASPLEHQATPDMRSFQYGAKLIRRYQTRPEQGEDKPVWDHLSEHGNYRGWRQHRKMLPGECVKD